VHHERASARSAFVLVQLHYWGVRGGLPVLYRSTDGLVMTQALEYLLITYPSTQKHTQRERGGGGGPASAVLEWEGYGEYGR